MAMLNNQMVIDIVNSFLPCPHHPGALTLNNSLASFLLPLAMASDIFLQQFTQPVETHTL